jgi:50S ribosomal protein L16 3-hydroxylase
MNDSALYASASPFDAIASDEPLTLLGGLTPQQFMQDYWQKKPLLIRQAIPNFVPPVDRRALFAFADQDDVESRLITFFRNRWKMDHGPFAAANLPSLKQKQWSLLVQSVNLFDPDVALLMGQFRFIPDARLDDVMISFATDGGGVGPHFDSYDVFLLQASGKRRWQISAQTDLTLRSGLPLKILADFFPEDTWTLEPGDMLYLPPQYAHDGVAEGECMTYSIGFRAPAYRELGGHFLAWLADSLEDHPEFAGVYADPEQPATTTPARIPSTIAPALMARLKHLAWDRDMVAEFVGAYLSEPKATAIFTPPKRPSAERFQRIATTQGVQLAAATIALYDAGHFYINGETYELPKALVACLTQLADTRQLHGATLERNAQLPDLLDTLFGWFEAGWIEGRTV